MRNSGAKILYMNTTTNATKSTANGIPIEPSPIIPSTDPAGDSGNGRIKTEAKYEESLLKKLFCNMLYDIYYAEKQLLKDIPVLQESSTTIKLKNAFGQQMQQTKKHVRRLEKIFGLIDKKAEEKPCTAMKGLITEAKSMISDTKEGTIIRDVALIVVAQKIKHYEIATYSNLVQLALISGLTRTAEILDHILMDEEDTDEMFSRIAEILVNIEAEEKNSVRYWNA